MPADFLLPLFAFTLIANAIFVAAAIRGMRRDEADPDRRSWTNPLALPTRPAPRDGDRPMTPELALAIAARQSVAEDAPPAAAGPEASPGTPPESAHGSAPEAPGRAPEGAQGSVPEATGGAAVAPPPPTAPKRRRTAKTASAGAAIPADAGPPSAEAPRRGRRRFSLPPLDDDHERVSRSIESFLGGADAGTESPTSAGATTVALVAVGGLPDDAGDETTAGAIAMVERTLRGAARGGDLVTVADRGRFRIVLPTTGELAARAYLRRIRATVEPLLGAADGTLSLAVATATVLDEPLEDAVRRAERRLASALEVSRVAGAGALVSEADDVAPGPRSAVD